MASITENVICPPPSTDGAVQTSKADCVRVALRIRPLVGKEKIERSHECITIPDKSIPQVLMGKKRSFTYDNVYGPLSRQDEVYDGSVKSLVDAAFDGYNATIFAYGQTGSGKTFTMGSGNNIGIPENERGLIPAVAKDIFARIESIKNEKHGIEFSVKVEFIEIYGEDMRDLLDPVGSGNSGEQGIQLRTLQNGQIAAVGCKSENVECEKDMLRCLERGSMCRTTGSTLMNAHSSRSHAIFTLFLEQRHVIMDNSCSNDQSNGGNSISPSNTGSDCTEVRSSKFHFVDLAGSERAKKTGAVGQRLKEGININVGLLALGNVISALGDPKKRGQHVPYRDSILTRMLQDSLGGNSKTLMIACVSPADTNFSETLSTLKYANRARNIQNKAIINRDAHSAQVAKLMNQIEILKLALVNNGGKVVNLHELFENIDSPIAVTPQDNGGSNNLFQRVAELDSELQRVTKVLKDTKNQLSKVTDEKIAALAERDSFKQQLVKNGIEIMDPKESKDFDMMLENQKVIDELKRQLEDLRRENRRKSNDFAPSTFAASSGYGSSRKPNRARRNSLDSPNWSIDNDILKRAKAQLAEEQAMLLKKTAGEESKLYHAENKEVADDQNDFNDDVIINNDDDEGLDEVDEETQELENSFQEQQHNIERNVADIEAGIKLKEDLIKEIEEGNVKFEKMKAFYTEKMLQLDSQVKQTEVERDQLLREMESLENAATEKEKKVKEALAKQLQEKDSKLRKQQKKLVEFRKFTNMKRSNHGQMEKARRELEAMKEQKIRLMKKAADKQKNFREQMKKRQHEIARLRKAATKNQQKINQLTSQNQQNAKLLKARATQINHAQKKIRKLTMRKLANKRNMPNNHAKKNYDESRKHRETSSAKSKTMLNIQSNLEKRASFIFNHKKANMELDEKLQKLEESNEELVRMEKQRNDILSSDQPDKEKVLEELDEMISESKDKIDYERTILKELVDKIESNDKKVNDCTRNFSKSVRDASELRLTLQTLFGMYLSQKKKLWFVRQDATIAREKYNEAVSELEQSRTATDIQRTEFSRTLNKVTLKQDEAVARALLIDNDDDESSEQEKNIHKNIKVAAPGSSEETIASLKIMQQMQKSHTTLAKKKIAEMEREKKLTDERVKQLVRRLVEKDSKLKKQEETISYLKGELDYSKRKNEESISTSLVQDGIEKSPATSKNVEIGDSGGKKVGDNYDMIGLDEITGAMFAASKSPEIQDSLLQEPVAQLKKHKKTMWSGSRLTKPTEAQRARQEATAKSVASRKFQQEQKSHDNNVELEKGWVGLNKKTRIANTNKRNRKSLDGNQLKQVFERTAASRTGNSYARRSKLSNDQENIIEQNDKVNMKTKSKGMSAEKQSSESPRKSMETRNPSNDTLGFYYIAGKSAAKAARTGSWRKKAKKKTNNNADKFKMPSRRLNFET